MANLNCVFIGSYLVGNKDEDCSDDDIDVRIAFDKISKQAQTSKAYMHSAYWNSIRYLRCFL